MQEVIGELTDKQRELILRGLRFVRSSVKLGMTTPTEDSEAARASDLQEVEALIARLEEAAKG